MEQRKGSDFMLPVLSLFTIVAIDSSWLVNTLHGNAMKFNEVWALLSLLGKPSIPPPPPIESEIKAVLDTLELKAGQPSNIRRISGENCVYA